MSPISRRRMLLAAAGTGTGAALGTASSLADEPTEKSSPEPSPAFRPEPKRAGTELITADAQRAIELRREFGSLAAYFWSFEPGPDRNFYAGVTVRIDR